MATIIQRLKQKTLERKLKAIKDRRDQTEHPKYIFHCSCSGGIGHMRFGPLPNRDTGGHCRNKVAHSGDYCDYCLSHCQTF
jgi:hypothetical protein